MGTIQSQSTSNPASISQKAAVAALTGPQDFVGFMVKEFARRRDVFVAALRAMEGVTCFNPKGAFYLFPCFKALAGRTYKGRKVTSISQWTEILLEDFHVAVVPGSEFGKEGHLRLSFATSMEVIEKGIERIKKAVRALD
jgi:aspartate aminotransferase